METPNLGRVIKSQQARTIIYTTYVVAVFAIGIATAGFNAVDGELPSWLLVATSMAAYAGAPVGALAAINTPGSTASTPSSSSSTAADDVDEIAADEGAPLDDSGR